MESKDKLKAVAIAGVLTAGWALGSKYIDYRKEIETAKIGHTATVKMLETIKNEQDNAMRLSLKDDGIESLEINGNTVTKADIVKATKVERKKYENEDKVYSGMFNISAIYRENENVYIDATGSDSEKQIRHINILADFISANDYDWLKNAVKGNPVEMTIITTEKNGTVISASLNSFKKE